MHGEGAPPSSPAAQEHPVAPWLMAGAAGAMGMLGAVLRHYGFELFDEGTLLAQFARVRAGQWPYRDFHTGYGPAGFAVNGALLALLGPQLEVVRLSLVGVQAAALAALAAVATRTLGRVGAVAVIALTLSFFRPIAPGAFCLWAIPYPGWYAHALGLLGIVCALGVVRRGRGALVAAGVCWGLAFCFKQNTGVLGLAAVVAWRALERGTPSRASAASWRGNVLAIAMTMGAALVAAAGWGTLGGLGTLAVGGPVVMLAWAIARARPDARLVGDAAALAGGWFAVAGTMLLVTWWYVGWPALARQVLHVHSGAADVYARAYPSVQSLVADVMAGTTGLRAGRQAIEALCFVLLPLAHGMAARGLWSRAGTPVWRLVVATAVLGYVEVYPRVDFWHLAPFAGVSLVVAIGVAIGAAAHVWPERRGAPVAVLVGLLVVAAVRWWPNVAVLRAVAGAQPPPATVARAAIHWELLESPALRAVPDVVATLAGAPRVIGFPALAAFNFLTGAPSPLSHDYFFPGVPPADEEARVLATLAGADEAQVVVLREPVAFVAEAIAAHPRLDAAIRESFPEITVIGPYEIRRRRP
jgi:hypothetical protein